jgi:hypothetical protein
MEKGVRAVRAARQHAAAARAAIAEQACGKYIRLIVAVAACILRTAVVLLDIA